MFLLCCGRQNCICRFPGSSSDSNQFSTDAFTHSRSFRVNFRRYVCLRAYTFAEYFRTTSTCCNWKLCKRGVGLKIRHHIFASWLDYQVVRLCKCVLTFTPIVKSPTAQVEGSTFEVIAVLCSLSLKEQFCYASKFDLILANLIFAYCLNRRMCHIFLALVSRETIPILT